MLVTFKHMRIVFLKQFRRNGLSYDIAYFILCRPQIAQVNYFAIGICSYRILCQVDVYRASQRICHNQRWRGQEARPYLWMDTPFKVAVATQYCRYYKVVFLYGLGDWLRQWTAITDAIVDRYCACHEGV